jgi:hypothetical protein
MTRRGVSVLLAKMRSYGLLAEQRGAPPTETQQQRIQLLTDWADILADVSDDDAIAALKRYVSSPHGQWYPAPGNILQYLSGRRSYDPVDEDEAAWDRIMLAVREYGIGGGRVVLTDQQRRALSMIGGRYDISKAASDIGLATLRKRFLAFCRRDPALTVPQLEERPRPRLQLVHEAADIGVAPSSPAARFLALAADEDDHADARAYHAELAALHAEEW